MRIWIVSCVFWLGLFGTVHAQEKCRWVAGNIFSKPAVADSLSLVETTIKIADKSGKAYDFKYDLSTNSLQILFGENEVPDSIRLCYRTFSIRLDKPVAKRTLLADYDSTARFKDNRIQESTAFDFDSRTIEFRSLPLLTSGKSFFPPLIYINPEV